MGKLPRGEGILISELVAELTERRRGKWQERFENFDKVRGGLSVVMTPLDRVANSRARAGQGFQ